jgi:hypothetical protein
MVGHAKVGKERFFDYYCEVGEFLQPWRAMTGGRIVGLEFSSWLSGTGEKNEQARI